MLDWYCLSVAPLQIPNGKPSISRGPKNGGIYENNNREH